MVSEQQPVPNTGLGRRLEKARTRLKLSQEAVAEAVGTTSRSIRRWEHNQAISQEYYRKRLCQVLQIPPESLFGFDDDQQQNASLPKSALLWHVPYTHNPYFTGREALLSRLHERLQSDHQVALTQPHIMSGLGGIGKTQTVLEYVYRFHQNYQAVLWVGAETPETSHGLRNECYLIICFDLPALRET